MTQFDPKANAPDPSTGGSRWLSSAGVFCVVFTVFKGRGKTRSQKPFVKFRGKVICGQPEGNEDKIFHERVFLNEEAWKRLGAMCQAMGQEEQFDLESDAAIRSAMMGKPFKAKFKVRTGSDNNQYAELAYSEHDCSEQEERAMEQWIDEAEAEGFFDRIHDQAEADDWGGGETPPPPTDDDDIPF